MGSAQSKIKTNLILKIILDHAGPDFYNWINDQMTSGESLKWRNFGVKRYNEVAVLLNLRTYRSFDEAWRQLHGKRR